MALTAGSRLGPYEISAPLGAGGMGEVYKARDTRLDRSVAVKVLPAHIATRDDLKARFEREARAVASLNHPNICTLFDIGNQDGVSFMVMELLEGETIAARIERGPIAVDSAVAFARQIADALDRAHRAGVTHRDVKPGNIMITRDGVKVLDFGLAKATGSASAPDDKTMSAVLTTEGTVLGTPQYMAPEQFEGREADARCDIWAFGAVLYEMVTGQKAFQGKTYSSLVGAILSAEPAPMAVKPFTPRWLERLVLRCLSKDPEDRYQSMRDVVLDLRAPSGEPEAVAPTKATRWPWIAATAVCAVLAVAGWLTGTRTSSPPTPVRLDVVLPPGTRPSTGNPSGIAISPDGTLLAFIALGANGQSMIFLRPIHSLEARPLTGTEGAGRPFWSPDSRSLGFVASGKLKRVDIAGGAPINLCDVGRQRGGSWNERGEILFAELNSGLWLVPVSGGTPAQITKIDTAAGSNRHYYPQFLPGGKEFLFWLGHSDPEKQGVYTGSLDGSAPKLLVKTEFAAIYDAYHGRLLYMTENGRLMARKLELNPPRFSGDPNLIAEGVATDSANGYVLVSVSSNGTLFYARGTSTRPSHFAWVDRSGKIIKDIGGRTESQLGYFSLSRDETKLVYVASGPRGPDLWTIQLTTGIVSRFTYRGGDFPVWSPDGKFVYYKNLSQICRRLADGSGEEEAITGSPVTEVFRSISPDGKFLLVGTRDLHTVAVDGDRARTPYIKTTYNEGFGVFSPDGRWVAYTSNESGRYEIYIQGFPNRSGKWQVTSDGGRFPVWRRDGKELFWLSIDGANVLSAPIELQPNSVKVQKPAVLFPYPRRYNLNVVEPAADGRRFVVIVPDGPEPPQLPMAVVTNWAAGLK